MAACSFTLAHAGTPETLYPVVQREVSQNGGSIQGSPTSGSIRMPTPAGPVALSYIARGSSIAVTVVDKPMLASCARIQSGLLELLSKVPPPTPLDVPGESGPAMPISHVIELPEVQILGDPDAPAPTKNLTPWLVAAGVGLVAIGTGFALSKPKRKPRYRRSLRA